MKVKSYNLEMDGDRHPMMVKENEYETDVFSLTCPESVDRFCREALRMDKMCEEYAYVICMNAKGKITGVFPLAHGSITYAVVCPRDVMTRVLLCGAASFAVIHNHPSGDVMPSNEDYEICKRISESAKIIGCNMVEFMIIGNRYYSFCESHEL